MKRHLAMGVIVTVLIAGSTIQGAITSTSVSLGMKIDVRGETEVIETNTGVTYASVDLVSPTTGAQVSALLQIDVVSNETVNLNFNLLLDGNNMAETSYLGRISSNSNFAEVLYHADVDARLDYSWNFDYTGSNPFGLGKIWVTENGTTITELGNIGVVGHYEGMDTISLFAGNDYIFQTVFRTNASGNVSNIEGTLAGNISFNFVPEPATLLLLGIGGLVLVRKQGE